MSGLPVAKISPIPLPKTVGSEAPDLRPLIQLISLQEREEDNLRAQEALKFRQLNYAKGIMDEVTGISALPGKDQDELNALKEQYGLNKIMNTINTPNGIIEATQSLNDFYADNRTQRLIGRNKKVDLLMDQISKHRQLFGTNAGQLYKDITAAVNDEDPNALNNIVLDDYIFEDFLKPMEDYLKQKTKKEPTTNSRGFNVYEEEYIIDDDTAIENLIERIKTNPKQGQMQGLLDVGGNPVMSRIKSLIQSVRPGLETSYSPASKEQIEMSRGDAPSSQSDRDYYKKNVFGVEGAGTEGDRDLADLMVEAKDMGIDMPKGSKEEKEVEEIVRTLGTENVNKIKIKRADVINDLKKYKKWQDFVPYPQEWAGFGVKSNKKVEGTTEGTTGGTSGGIYSTISDRYNRIYEESLSGDKDPFDLVIAKETGPNGDLVNPNDTGGEASVGSLHFKGDLGNKFLIELGIKGYDLTKPLNAQQEAELQNKLSNVSDLESISKTFAAQNIIAPLAKQLNTTFIDKMSEFSTKEKNIVNGPLYDMAINLGTTGRNKIINAINERINKGMSAQEIAKIITEEKLNYIDGVYGITDKLQKYTKPGEEKGMAKLVPQTKEIATGVLNLLGEVPEKGVFTDGHRTKAENKQVGGIESSWHKSGRAFDITHSNPAINKIMESEKMKEFLKRNGYEAIEEITTGTGPHWHIEPIGKNEPSSLSKKYNLE